MIDLKPPSAARLVTSCSLSGHLGPRSDWGRYTPEMRLKDIAKEYTLCTAVHIHLCLCIHSAVLRCLVES